LDLSAECKSNKAVAGWQPLCFCVVLTITVKMGYDKTDDIKKGVKDESAELSKRDGIGD
jgi:hypothetical protein